MRPFFLLAFALCACSQAVTSSATDAGADTASIDTGSSDDTAPADGPTLFFHVRATTAPFTQTDGLSGQTSTATKQGIRSLRVYRDATDTTGVLVFDHGKGFVEAGYDDGDDTVVGSAKVAAIAPGHYTRGRIAVTHSKYKVNTVMHVSGAPYPGAFDCVQTLSDDVTLDGVTHPASWYRYVFTTGGMSYPQEGTGAPLPTTPGTGGFTLKSEGGESYYEMPFDLTVDSHVTHDMKVIVEVNMDHGFRWEDQSLPGYAPSVYDTTPTDHEPVRRFGANSFTIKYE